MTAESRELEKKVIPLLFIRKGETEYTFVDNILINLIV